jgi:hypothetical protein
MPLVLLDHVRQELLDERKVADNVDAEDLADLLVRRLEDGAAEGDAGVVDQDRGVPLRRADCVGDFGDGGGGGDVAFVEGNV